MRKFLIFLILIAAVTRFILLDKVPAGINFEEIDYILNAKTVYTAWTDISGRWNPLSLATPPADEPRSELLPVIIAPLIGPLPFSLFNSRLPFALIGVFNVVLIYLLGRRLFDETVGRIAGIVAAFNPWLIFSSRLGFDVPTSATLFLFSFVLLLYLKKTLILLAFLPLFLAFYTYIGAKILFLPLTFITVWYSWQLNRHKYSRYYLSIIVLAIITFVYFLIRLNSLPASSRATNFFSPSHQDVTSTVNTQRQLNLEIIPPFNLINQIYVNRYAVFAKEILSRAVGPFSSSILFIRGDPYAPYFLWDHGLFYFSDALFILIGIGILFHKKSPTTFFLIFFIPVSILPSLISGTQLSFVYRSYLLFVFLTIIVALGIRQILSSSKNFRKLIIFFLISIYAFQIGNFAQDYLFRNPFYHESQFQLTSRILSRYIKEEAKRGQKVIVIGADPNGLFRQYVLYSGIFDKLSNQRIRNQLAEKFTNQNYSWENILFTADCEQASFKGDHTLIQRHDKPCQKIDQFSATKPIKLARISDSGADFKIYFGRTCSQFGLPKYIRQVDFNDLNIENISIKKYCQTFFEQS